MHAIACACAGIHAEWFVQAIYGLDKNISTIFCHCYFSDDLFPNLQIQKSIKCKHLACVSSGLLMGLYICQQNC